MEENSGVAATETHEADSQVQAPKTSIAAAKERADKGCGTQQQEGRNPTTRSLTRKFLSKVEMESEVNDMVPAEPCLCFH